MQKFKSASQAQRFLSAHARRIQVIVATRSFVGYHRKHAIRRRSFRRCWWATLDKHSVVLGLVQDEPALRAGAASGILDKTCARRSARGRSAPRNGPFDPTKECDLDLGSGQAASEADNASS
jgi:hypothetical protein